MIGVGDIFEGGYLANFLRDVVVDAISTNDCKRYYGGRILDSMFCAGKKSCFFVKSIGIATAQLCGLSVRLTCFVCFLASIRIIHGAEKTPAQEIPGVLF